MNRHVCECVSEAGLQHRPDIVLRGFDGPGSYTLLDIKTFDATGATHVNSQHTDARRSAAHASVALHCVNTEYGALPPRMRLIPLTVSIGGAFGPEAMRFLADLGKRAGSCVPVALLDCATWAAPRFAPFVRMAVSHAVRRGLAEAVLRRWQRVVDPADVISGQGVQPAVGPPPLPLAAIPLPVGMPAPLAPLPVPAGGGAWGGSWGSPWGGSWRGAARSVWSAVSGAYGCVCLAYVLRAARRVCDVDRCVLV